MRMFYDEPQSEYSRDGGKTWDPDNPSIGPTTLMRIVKKDGTVIFSASPEYTEITCDCCDGSGRRKLWRYVETKGGGLR